MTLIKNTTTGRFNTDVSEVMSHVRKPVFVDNAVHHARVSVQTSSKPKITVEKSNTRTLQVILMVKVYLQAMFQTFYSMNCALPNV